MAAPVTVYEIKLEEQGDPPAHKTYLRLPPPLTPYVLRISLDAGSKGSKAGVLHTNFPVDGGEFARDKFNQLPLPQDFSKPIQTDFKITKAGAYIYFIEYDLGVPGAPSKRIRSKPGYFAVDPILTIPSRTPILDPSTSLPEPVGKGGKVTKEETTLPLDGLVIQSVIAKWMGSIEDWAPHLDTIRDRGYNCIHFTPLQARGASNSPYSIFDQLEFSSDLFPKGTSKPQKEKLMREMLAKLKKEYGILGLTDVVYNHTAHNSEWLLEHPEGGYSPANSPHLEAAVELDQALVDFSASLEKRGLPTTLKTMADLEKIMEVLKNEVVPALKLWEYYAIDVKSQVERFATAWTENAGKELPPIEAKVPFGSLHPKELSSAFAQFCLPRNWDLLSTRSGTQVQPLAAVSFVAAYLGKSSSSPDTLAEAKEALTAILNIVNVPRYEMYDDDLKSILEQTKGRVKYTRLDDHGPKFGPITPTAPLVESLFTRLPVNAATKKHDPKALVLANNGWIWDADPLKDFAAPESRVYLRRELIVWGDCVKLRFGTGPDDNPWLWEHMTAYTELLASLFAGFRLDNCHSTPMHVGEYLLDKARKVNPDLYVCAELFTGSQETDLLFVCRLGLNSLIREAYNSNDSKDMSSLLYSYGIVKPIGSMDTDCLVEKGTIELDGSSTPCQVFQLPGSKPHAFIMDITHDNESPMSKRTAEDAQSTGALVTMCNSAVGSNKGFDDLYPKLLDVVSEVRHYETYADPTSSGLSASKRILNHLHAEMAQQGYVEGHFHQESDFIISHRMHPVTHKGFLVVTRTAFPGASKDRGYVAPVKLYGAKARFVFGQSVEVLSREDPSTDETLKGLEAKVTVIKEAAVLDKKDDSGPYSELEVPKVFLPGSVLIFETWMDVLKNDVDEFCTTGADEAFSGVDMVDLNALMYRADGEERDAVGGDGTYAVPGLGSLVYCGLQGWMSHLLPIMRKNDLGHPLCNHLREGTWALDYVHSRLEKQFERMPNLKAPAAWLAARFDLIKSSVPNFLRPKYFAMITNTAFKAARDRAVFLSSPSIQQGNDFVVALALTAVQMYGLVRSASLDPGKETPSLAAGLPHFTAGWARTWGRDVFICLRGLCLVTGQFEAAKDHILAFCSVVKHGLIPNLLDSCRTPRYNSRDSPWWMVQNIQDYVNMVPDGIKILDEKVKKRFPSTDEWVPWDDPKAYSEESTVAEIVQDIVQRHARGIHFREYNAGPNLDMQMSDRGFNIDIEVDWKTGIPLGGNEFNCGTWMDKMGESEKAGTRGVPGTARDGAPVEITGLLKSALTWLDALAGKGKFPFKSVQALKDGKEVTVTYKEWADLLQASFEKYYWIPEDAADDKDYVVDAKFVNRRGIYKDVYGTPAGREKADYQLRANFPVAMTVAPELFSPDKAIVALRQYEKVLVGPLGVRTLDPSDSDYRGDYDNANDSHDPAVAKGRNYHQGPEWVWPLGYFLRAYTTFDVKAGDGKTDANITYHHIYSILSQHRWHIRNDPWAGLPELTNHDGWECYDSCRTQAWSGSTLLDALSDIQVLTKSIKSS